ncbi:MAG TPA: hypothetical protein VFN30_04135 [Chitinophagaceae bacterium]|nr:hypothetical protein [Chitinophagaceae bacterium]
MKKSVAEDQLLTLSSIDFLRATGGRKVKFTFDAQLVNGKLSHSDKQTTLIRDLVLILQEDETIKKFITEQSILLTMDNNFLLRIKNTTAPVQTG